MNSSSADTSLGQCSGRHERTSGRGREESHYYYFYGLAFLFLMEVDLGNLLRITFFKLNFNQKDKFSAHPNVRSTQSCCHTVCEGKQENFTLTTEGSREEN